MFFVSSRLLLFTLLITQFISIISPFETISILPCSGILSNKMLQPVQPALFAVSAKGLRFSIISGTKNALELE